MRRRGYLQSEQVWYDKNVPTCRYITWHCIIISLRFNFMYWKYLYNTTDIIILTSIKFDYLHFLRKLIVFVNHSSFKLTGLKSSCPVYQLVETFNKLRKKNRLHEIITMTSCYCFYCNVFYVYLWGWYRFRRASFLKVGVGVGGGVKKSWQAKKWGGGIYSFSKILKIITRLGRGDKVFFTFTSINFNFHC